MSEKFGATLKNALHLQSAVVLECYDLSILTGLKKIFFVKYHRDMFRYMIKELIDDYVTSRLFLDKTSLAFPRRMLTLPYTTYFTEQALERLEGERRCTYWFHLQ